MLSGTDRKIDARSAAAFARLAAELHEQFGVRDTAETVVTFALQVVACDEASLVLLPRRPGDVPRPGFELVAATGQVGHRDIATQLRLCEGPCLSAVARQVRVLVRDAVDEARWPAWAAEVPDLGVRSALVIPVGATTVALGALSLLAGKPDAFRPEDVAIVHTLARHASVALAAARHEEDLWSAIDSRKTVGQAQGILMERFGLTDDQAFALLNRYARKDGVGLTNVARCLVSTRKLPDADRGW
jgi:GAF domain-containing protein